MALNLEKELDRYLESSAEALLATIKEQPLKRITPEKVKIMHMAAYYDRVYYLIERAELADVFVQLLSSPDVETQVTACQFLKGCCMFHEQYGDPLQQKFIRLFELVGDDKRGLRARHQACSLLCHMARNENFHEDILQNTYSLIDLLRSRDWFSERTAAVLAAYAFTNPILMEQAVGVTAKTDLLVRMNKAYLKSNDYIARRFAVKVLAAAGRGRASMTNDDVAELRNNVRIPSAALQSVAYFVPTVCYAMLRHYRLWGIRGQVGPVVGASVLAGCVSALFGVRTGEYLDYRIENMKQAYMDRWGVEQRKDRLRRLNLQMSRLPGGKSPALGQSIPVRYHSLAAITSESFEAWFQTHQTCLLYLAFVSVPLPWYLVVPRLLSHYQQLRLGPRFHRLFPALSLKYTRRPRAIIPFVFVPTVAVKLASYNIDSPYLWNPLRLFTF
ncbi:hypothetical protein DIPPA_24645 [Diplonema papillatum]|nr:hypothetical protein DIPPA_24645 [Diplonema papillatum]KAJ9464476.1 hypothetical protein DIPPA_24645 [Diplonema papillatum]KAJ9464477.1 hypothetical protein DIPPA_24645 [Diplonema papillatum]